MNDLSDNKKTKKCALCEVVSGFNYRFWKWISNIDKNSDIDRIWVDGQGNFGMKSKDIFRDKGQSLKTLDKLRNSVKNYRSNN